jgi:Holliday junction resolvasome RuvABC endonuclease subunit
MEDMRVLVLDQATRVSGWAYFENSEYVESGLIDMNKSTLSTHERSFEMAKALWKMIKKYNPERLIIEDTQQQNNVKTVITLARLQGMIIGYAEAHDIKVHILLPSAWRKVLGYSQGPKVKRAELKQQSIDYIKNKYKLDLQEDECESCCINEAAHKIYNFSDDDIWGEK